jgi:hypothetical protein
MRPEEWLLIDWPNREVEPTKYFLSTAPADATPEQLVFVTKMRWRIERARAGPVCSDSFSTEIGGALRGSVIHGDGGRRSV